MAKRDNSREGGGEWQEQPANTPPGELVKLAGKAAGAGGGRGGKRPGAGRKPKATLNADPEKKVEETISQAIQREWNKIRRTGITTELVRDYAALGLATLVHEAGRGSVRSAIYLVNLLLGAPDVPFVQKVQQMSEEEVRASLLAEFQGMGFSESTAQAMVDRAFEEAEKEAELAAAAAEGEEHA